MIKYMGLIHKVYSHGWYYSVLEGSALTISYEGYTWDNYSDFIEHRRLYEECKTIYVPDVVKLHYKHTFYSFFSNLQEIIASPNNTTYETHDGVLCRSGSILYIPHGKKTLHIDKSITQVEYGAFDNCHNLEIITLDPENTSFLIDDGCLYNKNMTMLYFIPYSKKKYHLPKTLSCIASFVLENVCLEYLSVDAENPIFSVKDGVLYDKNTILYILPQRTFLSIPAAIENIKCSLSGIETITVDPNNKSFRSADNCLFDKSGETLIYFPNTKRNLTIFSNTKISRRNLEQIDTAEWNVTIIFENDKRLYARVSPKKLNECLNMIRLGKMDIKAGTEYVFLELYLSGCLHLQCPK